MTPAPQGVTGPQRKCRKDGSLATPEPQFPPSKPWKFLLLPEIKGTALVCLGCQESAPRGIGQPGHPVGECVGLEPRVNGTQCPVGTAWEVPVFALAVLECGGAGLALSQEHPRALPGGG